uniref:MMS19 nucleotide excision repair protein n=1 Tax=Kalanchoe fedtschenkoi TaxID=63787 RepID=A0A7N0RGM5_KALFE
MLAMSSTPFFETHAVPLFLEKLSSSLLSAKVDSLKYLSDCVPKYGKGRMKQHAESIWSSVKETLYAAEPESTLSLTSELLDANQSQGNEVVREALVLLQKVVMQNDEKYSRLIISDAAINMIIDSTVNTCSDSNFSSVSMQKLHAVGCIMYASAKASSVCCSKLFGTYFLRLLNVIGFPDRNLSLCNTNGDVSLSQNLNVSALYLCIELLAACRDLMIDSTALKSEAAAAGETWPSNLKSYSACLIKGLSATLLSSPDQGTQDAIIYLGVKGLGILATLPEDFSSVPKSFFEDILQAFMTIFTTKYDNASLWSQATKELVLVGSYVSKHRDSERMLSFMSTVIDKMISLIFLDDGSIPLLVKLDTVCDIGTTYLKYMLRIFQGLEEVVSANFSNAKVNGNVKAAEIINQIMKRYTAKVLPCLGEAGEADDIIYHFAINIWGHVERSAFQYLSSDHEEKEMLSTTMMALKVAVSYCTVERQSKILEKAFNVLSSNVPSLSTASKSGTISPQMKDDNHTEELHNRQCMKERPLSALASVIIAVRPQTSIPNEREVAHLFVAALLEGHIPSAQALGSMFNKLHMKTNGDVLIVDLSVKELTSVLSCDPSNNGFTWSCSAKKDTGDEGLPHLSFDSEKASLVSSHAVRGLAWMAKGLLMRGHEKAYDIINILLSLLVQDETVNGLPIKHRLAYSDRDQKIMETAADAFEVIMGDSDICLNTRFHAVIRPLYKQRLLSTIMPLLLSEIRKCDSPSSRYMLYRASGHVLSNAPLGAVLNDSRKLIPVLVECLSLLSNDASNKENTYRLLLVLSAILTEESAAGQETVKENARIIIDCLIGLVAYPHKMAVRETAIQCLVALSRLPQTRIYPMKSQVLRVVSKAVDDPKRAVRLQAVRCREAWQSNSSQY